MAERKIQMQYDLKQNSSENSRVYGLWFPRVIRNTTLSLRGLCDHIAGHGSIYTPDVVYGVLNRLSSCVIELVSQGSAVKIDGLGTFYPTVKSNGADNAVGYNIAEHVEGVRIRFLPEGAAEDKITSKAFLQKVSLKQRLIFDMYGVPKKVVNGELVNYGKEDTDDDENNG